MEEKKQTSSSSFQLQGKDYILFESLLNLGHQEG